jgi:hypothetical protein
VAAGVFDVVRLLARVGVDDARRVHADVQQFLDLTLG